MPSKALSEIANSIPSTRKAFLYGALFLVTSLYVVSQAADIFVFHFFVDIYLARITMLVMAVSLGIMAYGEVGQCFSRFRSLLIIVAGWTLYLVINTFLGANAKTSLELLLRFVGAWVIAFEIGILAHATQKKSLYVMGVALLFGLLMITLLWYLQTTHSPYFHWLRIRLRHYTPDPPRVQGLYVNPNTLGIVLALHASVLIWYTLDRYFSLFIIPLTWLLALAGILECQSKSALIGMFIVCLLSLFTYWKLFLNPYNKKTNLMFSFAVCIIATALILIAIHNSRRLDLMISRISHMHLAQQDLNHLLHSLEGIDEARVTVWSKAYEFWSARPWTGIGLGSFQYMPEVGKYYHCHDFLYTILVEQGLIGMAFLLLFVCLLIWQMRSWIGVALLSCVVFSQLFDDLALSIAFPTYVSLILGYCFYLVLERQTT